MRIAADLDVDVVGLDWADQVAVLVELTAPAHGAGAVPRPASTLEVVLDRSGSMSGDRLEGAKAALIGLVDRLDPQDNFGLVAFDDAVRVVVPAGKLTNRLPAKQAISAIVAGRGADMSAGYLRGLQEAQRVAGPAGATVLLISAGRANAGVTEPARLLEVAATAYGKGVTTSTIGYGLGYDERIMSAIARGGCGNELFADNRDAAGELVAGELDPLLTRTAQAASLNVRVSPQVRQVRVVNDLPVAATGRGVRAELGAFCPGEARKVLLTIDLAAIATPGLAEVATLELTWVSLPSLTQHSLTMPVHVNVVPGDIAAGRLPDPVVRTELAYLTAQQAKRRASGHLSDGDAGTALMEVRAAQAALLTALFTAPEHLCQDIADEVKALQHFVDEIRQGRLARAAKYSSSDAARKSRQRGRFSPEPARREPPGTCRESDLRYALAK